MGTGMKEHSKSCFILLLRFPDVSIRVERPRRNHGERPLQVEGHCLEEIKQEHDKEKFEKALLLRAGLCVLSGRIDEAAKDVDQLLSRENVDIKVSRVSNTA